MNRVFKDFNDLKDFKEKTPLPKVPRTGGLQGGGLQEKIRVFKDFNDLKDFKDLIIVL